MKTYYKNYISLLFLFFAFIMSANAQKMELEEEVSEPVTFVVDTAECCVNCAYNMQFQSMETALLNPSEVHCLVLSFGSPKFTSIPKEVALFENLTCLDISFNRVAVIPEEILQCTKLHCLELSGNHYLQDLPHFLKKLPNLKVVRLYDMKLWSEAKKQQVQKDFDGISLEFE
ncbi:MAG: leucine-rich repeat domain-containing protein [Paludibacteraceae bacterium]|nr:leucine-rich repeat domain-containing protein [Paludibacteraceae bacterium]MBP6285074.1 leucine-rich repeat domain-containing protein [Paludibacteraceae bacterium]